MFNLLSDMNQETLQRGQAIGQAVVEVYGCKCGYVHDIEAPCYTGVPIKEFTPATEFLEKKEK